LSQALISQAGLSGFTGLNNALTRLNPENPAIDR
jgi:hypothetical protein